MSMANDQLRLLPHHGVAHGHGYRVVRLAAASTTFQAVRQGLPTHARAEVRLRSPADAIAAGALAAAFHRAATPAAITPGTGRACFVSRSECEADWVHRLRVRVPIRRGCLFQPC